MSNVQLLLLLVSSASYFSPAQLNHKTINSSIQSGCDRTDNLKCLNPIYVYKEELSNFTLPSGSFIIGALKRNLAKIYFSVIVVKKEQEFHFQTRT